jgi:hypothetical protein
MRIEQVWLIGALAFGVPFVRYTFAMHHCERVSAPYLKEP